VTDRDDGSDAWLGQLLEIIGTKAAAVGMVMHQHELGARLLKQIVERRLERHLAALADKRLHHITSQRDYEQTLLIGLLETQSDKVEPPPGTAFGQVQRLHHAF